MQTRSRFIIALVALVALGPVAAQAQWYDGFESYPAGGGLHGMGGWAGWNDDPAFDAIISDFYAYTGLNSVAIAGNADIVQRFSGYNSGAWELVAWMFIPSDFSGQTYFIVLNTYTPNGDMNWSVEVNFTNGQVTDYAGTGSLPYVVGEWAEIRLEIDLVANLQTFYYNGDFLYTASWTEGASGGGALDIGALDLFANGATPVYFDDISLSQGGVATQPTSLSAVKNLFR